MTPPPAKIAIINATGLPELPLLDRLAEGGHHLVYLSPGPLPRDFVRRHGSRPRFEHHRIRLHDTRQIVTALQDCRLAVLCHSNLPLPDAEDRARLTAACTRAQVPQFVDLDLSPSRPLMRALTTRPKLPPLAFETALAG